MGHCNICGAELAYPFECSHCGETFCAEHRFPENHSCRIRRPNFSKDSYNPENNAPAGESHIGESVNLFKKKSISKIVLAAFALILVASITSGFLVGTSLNHPSGNTDRNSQDYVAGYTNGNSTGYLAGYSEGNSSGYATGYADGTSTGYLAGCTDGNSSGYDTGYRKGFKDATESAYLLKDPSYLEMRSFLASDNTDSQTYDEIDYNCYDFASSVCNHAFELGYRCGFVYIELSNSTEDFTAGRPTAAHAIVCFNTTDKGLIFIEPQSDLEVSLTIGEPITVIFPEWGFSYYLMPEIILDYGIIW
jgi:hypothetical protein